MRGKIIVCGSQKGGVGKTVTTFNLAYALTSLGKKVLAVDFDSQGNLSTCMGIEDLRIEEKTIGHGGRYEGEVHIAPAEELGIRQLQEEIERALRS